jgi:hypothetical protein
MTAPLFYAGTRILAATMNTLTDFAMELLAQATLTSPSAQVTIGVPSNSFSNLKMTIVGKTSTTGSFEEDIRLQYNGVSSANYNEHFIFVANNTTVAAAFNSTQTASCCGHLWTSDATGSGAGRCEVTIPDYATTTWTKGHTYVANATDGGTSSQSGVGGGACTAVTAAITSLSVQTRSGSNFVAGTTFTLYGF